MWEVVGRRLRKTAMKVTRRTPRRLWKCLTTCASSILLVKTDRQRDGERALNTIRERVARKVLCFACVQVVVQQRQLPNSDASWGRREISYKYFV